MKKSINKLSRVWACKLMLLVGFATMSISSAFAEADPALWPVMKEAFFTNREIKEVDFMKIDAPKRAESGAQVPVSYSIDNAAAAADGIVIKKVFVIVDSNPIPITAVYHLTEGLGNFHLSTRIRFETDGFVRMVGETADGKLYLASRAVRAAGGCGGTVENSEETIRQHAGQMKMNVEAPVKFGTETTATFNIKHVMRTGLQRDLVSQGYVPAFFINQLKFTYNAKPLLTVDVGVGTAEDPYFKFSFTPAEPGKLDVTATDNEGKTFAKEVDVKA